MKLNYLLPVLALTLAGRQPAPAEVTVSSLFADHAVLQRDAKAPVWGWATPGEKITVEFAGQTKHATTDAKGEWRVDLAGLKPGGPFTLKIAGANRLTIDDVFVGDVWLCSGQSNMAFSMGALRNTPYAPDLESAQFPKIRQALVARKPSPEPVGKVDVTWSVCTPETVEGFTATGFYFARELQKELGIPIGLIHSSWGGTSAESWTSKPALDTVPAFKERAEQQLANLATLPEKIKAFPAALTAWENTYARTDSGNEGEKQGWAVPETNTLGWKPIALGTKWKAAGLPNGGIVWLRKDVEVPANAAGKGLRLDFGMIDEQFTAAYFNGKKLGDSGRKAPEFYAGYVGYNIPGSLVKAGRNVLAVRFVADTGDRPGISRRAKTLGFAALGIADLSDDFLVKVEKEFPPLTKAALLERPLCPRGDGAHTSSALFGGMIHPLIPFGIKGAIWYQG